MTFTTTAAVLRDAAAPYSIEQITLGPLAGDDVLISVTGVGLCHTDVIPREMGERGRQLMPIILGHEGSGVVQAVGDRVSGVAVGDHVMVSYDSCGLCRNCMSGRQAYCDEFNARNLTGRRVDGSTSATDAHGAPVANRWFGQSTFAVHAIATARNVVVVDKSIPLELLGPLGCGLQTGAGSVLNEMKIQAGQSIAIFGAGGVGLAAVMAAKIAGATDIVVVDLHQSRLDMALELGATRVVRGDAPDVSAEIIGSTRGMDFTLETTSVPANLAAAATVLDRPGKVVYVGGGSGQITFPAQALAGKTATFALEGSSTPQVFLPRLVDFWQRGLFPFEKFVKTYDLRDIDQAENDSRSGKTIKPILLPQGA